MGTLLGSLKSEIGTLIPLDQGLREAIGKLPGEARCVLPLFPGKEKSGEFFRTRTPSFPNLKDMGFISGGSGSFAGSPAESSENRWGTSGPVRRL